MTDSPLSGHGDGKATRGDQDNREQCPECDSAGEVNRIVAGDEEWGCPVCENTWWVTRQ